MGIKEMVKRGEMSPADALLTLGLGTFSPNYVNPSILTWLRCAGKERYEQATRAQEEPEPSGEAKDSGRKGRKRRKSRSKARQKRSTE